MRSVSINSGADESLERVLRLENLEISRAQGSLADLKDSRMDMKYASARLRR